MPHWGVGASLAIQNNRHSPFISSLTTSIRSASFREAIASNPLSFQNSVSLPHKSFKQVLQLNLPNPRISGATDLVDAWAYAEVLPNEIETATQEKATTEPLPYA